MPEGGRPSLETRSVHEHEVTLVDVVNELRIVKEESRQLRTRMEGVDARQIEALKTEWVHRTRRDHCQAEHHGFSSWSNRRMY